MWELTRIGDPVTVDVRYDIEGVGNGTLGEKHVVLDLYSCLLVETLDEFLGHMV